MNVLQKLLLLSLFTFLGGFAANAQQQLVHDYSQLMEIPDVVAMEASPTHLYVLSEQSGLAVFRSYADSLQWLYTSSGMQRRGDVMRADIRFAYLYGNSRRLTVLEPTSALGVYSSTVLPAPPLGTARINNTLYVAMGEEGLGKLSLESPETVDSEISLIMENELSGTSVLDVRSSHSGNQLFVLNDEPELLIFNQNNQGLELRNRISLRQPIERLFIDGNDIWGSTARGELFEIRSSGTGNKVGQTGSSISQMLKWNEYLIARSRTGEVQVWAPGGNMQNWKTDGEAGNYLAKSLGRLWISENSKISEITIKDENERSPVTSNNSFTIKDIPNQVVAYPNPLVLPLEMEGNYAPEGVEFAYRSTVDNAKIRKQGFYWQPTVNQTGTYWFNIIATNAQGDIDSTRFTVDVRSFNSPPRFSPVRSTTIAVNENYSFQFHATDPENPQSSLIRYIGVDMPEGAQLNEQTGEFSWTPGERQIGETTFRVVATDRHGAATSTELTLRVRDISRGSGD